MNMINWDPAESSPDHDRWLASLASSLPRLYHAFCHLPQGDLECQRFMDGLQWEMVSRLLLFTYFIEHSLIQNDIYFNFGAATQARVSNIQRPIALRACSIFVHSREFTARDVTALRKFVKTFLRRSPVDPNIENISFPNSWWLELGRATPSPDVRHFNLIYYFHMIYGLWQLQSHIVRRQTLLQRMQDAMGDLQEVTTLLDNWILAKEQQLEGIIKDCATEMVSGDKLDVVAMGSDGIFTTRPR